MPINQLVQYCNEQYNRDVRCTNCPNEEGCTSCLRCLEHIHNVTTQSRTYNCPNIAFCYTCKHIFRYSSEIEYLLRNYISVFRKIQSVRVCSIGCGPCSELFGLHNFKTINNLNFQIEYKGFDLNHIWQPIHGKINDLFSFDTEFIYDDVFNYYQEKETLPNVLILNYLLSDILRINTATFNDFIDKLCTFYKKMSNSLLIVNDINLGKRWYEITKQVRDYYEPLIKRLQKENNIQHIERFHFTNSHRWCYSYGNQHQNNSIKINPAQEIIENYSPWTECRSAQFIICKKAK